MLRINRLRIEIKTANRSHGGVYGFDEKFYDGLNFIASLSNTSGKSSIIEAIFYCLGFEEIIGGRNEKVLTSVYKTTIKDNDKDWNVLESGAFLEISNGNETVTLYRSATMEGRDSRLITVYYGDYDSIGNQKTPPEDMYLHDGGAATNEKGFHAFLESFLHLHLPLVQTNGNDQKLYLQVIFSCLFIEQKHGWGDIFSGMPYFGIRDAKKRVVEFLLGLDTFKNERDKDKLNAIKNAITSEWKAILDDINRNANHEFCSVGGLSREPSIMSDRDYKVISVMTADGKTLNDAISELQAKHDSIKQLKPRNIDNFEALNEELQTITETIASFEQKAAECDSQITLSRSAIAQAERSLEVVLRDLRNNKDAAKLQNMGSITGCQASTNVCPTCYQQIQDSLLHIGEGISIMSVEENIRHLEGQKSVLEFTRDSHKTNVEQFTLVKNDLQSRLLTLRRLAQTIRSDIYSTETDWSESIIQKLVEIETKIRKYEQLRAFIIQQLDKIKELSNRWTKYKEERAKLPPKTVSDSDIEIITTFKRNFITNLRKYKYKSAPNIDAVDIPIETCLPTIDGFDMKFDSSASDNIRIIWSFTIALLQTSVAKSGNHPGIVIFDEPAQHSIVTSDMDSLIQSIRELKGSSQVIIGITLNNEELRDSIENLPKRDATIINVGDRAFQLLND
ncbi:MAG: hypothetical protein K0S22_1788 [Oscillospiraceae bacterium]|jgi:chromosome segregation ATPase|nr:hypothetical protein [Oscillospiraceae bacterium]